jgi:hypothetical protein
VQAAAAGADLAGGLQAAQHQHRQHRHLVLLERPLDAHPVLVFRHPGAGGADAADQAPLDQALQRVLHRVFDSCITGSRLDSWLQPLTMALSDIG